LPRIVYLVPNPGVPTGGNKVVFRHVEALAALGYEAVVRIPPGRAPPAWFAHTAAVEATAGAPRPDDILVFPDDAPVELGAAAHLPNAKVVFVQNPYWATHGVPYLTPEQRAAYRVFMACSAGVAGWTARFLDHESITTVPAFADERLFRPAAKTRTIACIPRKRTLEYRAIRYMFQRLRPDCDWRWEVIDNRTEAETAAAMGQAAVYLSLARLEGMSMTVVEAMASGCLVAGFTGIGPREYTRDANGIWVEEDDCEGAAHALARAVDLAEADGPEAAAMQAAALATAAGWTHAACVGALDAFWRDRLTLCKSGPFA
jgi:glycosyltransferase involved in cell wall biosynthesis